MPALAMLLTLLRASFASRADLAIENLALRHQIGVLRRTVKRPKVEDRDRRLWILLKRLHERWRECLLVVQPDTVIRWHRRGWRTYWGRKSVKKRQGRPAIGWPLVRLIQRMSRENVTWGAPRIQSELALLGHDVGQMTVQRYMVKRLCPTSTRPGATRGIGGSPLPHSAFECTSDTRAPPRNACSLVPSWHRAGARTVLVNFTLDKHSCDPHSTPPNPGSWPPPDEYQ